MEHLFKFLLLAPYFYFDNWIEKANRNSKFFPIFYYFYWIYISILALFSLDMTIFSFLFFPFVLNHESDASAWGVGLLLIVLSLGSDWLDYIFFKKMLRLRKELGKSTGGRYWFISVFIYRRWLMERLKSFITQYSKFYIGLVLLIWIAFFFLPWGSPILGGEDWPLQHTESLASFWNSVDFDGLAVQESQSLCFWTYLLSFFLD